jgi:hypothetical protein
MFMPFAVATRLPVTPLHKETRRSAALGEGRLSRRRAWSSLLALTYELSGSPKTGPNGVAPKHWTRL